MRGYHGAAQKVARGVFGTGGSGVASGVLNSARQIGSVLGVSLFGSLIGHAHGFIAGMRVSLTISAGLLLGGCVAMLLGGTAGRRCSPQGRRAV